MGILIRFQLICFLVFAVSFLLPSAILSYAQDRPERQINIQASILYNLPKFISWENNENLNGDVFHYCILEDEPITSALRRVVAGKKINNMTVKVTDISETGPEIMCNILFFGERRVQRLAEYRSKYGQNNILYVGSHDEFLKRGGDINLVVFRNKISIEINEAVIHIPSLSINSRLLNMASIKKVGGF